MASDTTMIATSRLRQLKEEISDLTEQLKKAEYALSEWHEIYGDKISISELYFKEKDNV